MHRRMIAAAVMAVVALMTPSSPCGLLTGVLAQETKTLPPAQSLPAHSEVDVLSLPPMSLRVGPKQMPTEVKPYRVPDPQRLKQWKDDLEQSPGVVPPAPGFVEDRPRQSHTK